MICDDSISLDFFREENGEHFRDSTEGQHLIVIENFDVISLMPSYVIVEVS